MSEGRVTCTIEGPLARIVIDQPAKMNAMSFAMWSSLPALVAQAQAMRRFASSSSKAPVTKRLRRGGYLAIRGQAQRRGRDAGL